METEQNVCAIYYVSILALYTMKTITFQFYTKYKYDFYEVKRVSLTLVWEITLQYNSYMIAKCICNRISNSHEATAYFPDDITFL